MSTIIVYGATIQKDGASLGIETLVRCVAGKRCFKKEEHSGECPVIVLTAGFLREKQVISMAEMMKNCIIGHGVPSERIFCEGVGRNTMGETQTAVALIEEKGLARNVVIVSSAYHISRVKLTWKRHRYKVRTFQTRWHPSLRMCVREVLAWCATFFYLDRVTPYGARFNQGRT